VNRCNNRLQPAGEPTAYTHRGDLLELVRDIAQRTVAVLADDARKHSGGSDLIVIALTRIVLSKTA
jgi:hypothetical protein